MAKRMTDSDKWKKGFIRGLAPKYKLFWLYILDDCTHAGIWETDFEVASIFQNIDAGKTETIHEIPKLNQNHCEILRISYRYLG